MSIEPRWWLAGATALILALAPLPFGSVVPWADAGLQVAFLTLWALALARPLESSPWLRARRPAAALGLLGVLGLLQSMPLPRALLPSFGGSAAGAEAPAGWGPLSLSPWLTLSTALACVALAAALLLGAELSRLRPARRLLWGSVLLASVFQVVYGARGWLDRAQTVWGVAVPTDLTRLRGTFVNPNHLALYLEVALAGTAAWLWWQLARNQEGARFETRLLRLAPPLALGLLLLGGLLGTGSRAGLLAAAAGLGWQLWLGLGAALSRRKALVVVAGLVGAGALGLAALGLRTGFDRFLEDSLTTSGGAGRLPVWQASLELFYRSPVLGTGLGSFRDAFPLVQPPSSPGSWWHAHNDWLELLVTSGALGLGLALFGFVAAWRALATCWRHGWRSEDRAAVLAAWGALVAVAVHELFDFGLTMPANAFTLALVVGLALGVRARVSAVAHEAQPEPATSSATGTAGSP
jgi:O-antigen ligase